MKVLIETLGHDEMRRLAAASGIGLHFAVDLGQIEVIEFLASDGQPLQTAVNSR